MKKTQEELKVLINRSPTFESAKQSVQQFRTGSLRLQDQSSKCVGFSYIGQLLHQLKSTYCRLRTSQSMVLMSESKKLRVSFGLTCHY